MNKIIHDTITDTVYQTITRVDTVTKYILNQAESDFWGTATGNLVPALVGGLISGLVAVGAAYLTVRWTQRGDKENIKLQVDLQASKDRELEEFRIERQNETLIIEDIKKITDLRDRFTKLILKAINENKIHQVRIYLNEADEILQDSYLKRHISTNTYNEARSLLRFDEGYGCKEIDDDIKKCFDMYVEEIENKIESLRKQAKEMS